MALDVDGLAYQSFVGQMATAAAARLWIVSNDQVTTTRWGTHQRIFMTVADCSCRSFSSLLSRQQLAASTATETAVDEHSSETAAAHAVYDEVGGGVEGDQHVTGSRKVTSTDDE